jgi:hypothetical protein
MAQLRPIIFFRNEGFFYLTEYPEGYTDWQAEAERNPGTTRIMDAITGKVLWLPSVDGGKQP